MPSVSTRRVYAPLRHARTHAADTHSPYSNPVRYTFGYKKPKQVAVGSGIASETIKYPFEG